MLSTIIQDQHHLFTYTLVTNFFLLGLPQPAHLGFSVPFIFEGLISGRFLDPPSTWATASFWADLTSAGPVPGPLGARETCRWGTRNLLGPSHDLPRKENRFCPKHGHAVMVQEMSHGLNFCLGI